jgi:ADP-ribose pyrophosphatase YjhB (NUDIX family)
MAKKIVKSAGGLVFRDNKGKLEVLLGGGSKTEADYWGFPKGRQKAGELIEMTALREIREETGIQTELLALLGRSEYTLANKNGKQHKFVYYYLARAVGGNLEDKDDELQYVRWVSLTKAAALLTYDADRELLTKATKMTKKWYREML